MRARPQESGAQVARTRCPERHPRTGKIMEGRMSQPSFGILPRHALQREKSEVRCAIPNIPYEALLGFSDVR